MRDKNEMNQLSEADTVLDTVLIDVQRNDSSADVVEDPD